jgi:hypothetical protein
VGLEKAFVYVVRNEVVRHMCFGCLALQSGWMRWRLSEIAGHRKVARQTVQGLDGCADPVIT